MYNHVHLPVSASTVTHNKETTLFNLKSVVSLLRVIVTLLSLSPFGRTTTFENELL